MQEENNGKERTEYMNHMKKFLFLLALPFVVSNCSSQSEKEQLKNVQPVEIGFYETYDYVELFTQWNALDSWVKQNDSLLATKNIKGVDLKNWVVQNMPGCIGTVLPENVETINTVLALPEVMALFPKNVKFMWSQKPEDLGGGRGIRSSLYALKVPEDGKAIVNGKHIESATADRDRRTASMIILINLTDEGQKIWGNMTTRNINKSIAIAVDGMVISCPTVINAITSGATQISGDFSVEEAKDLARGISAGR